MTFKSSTFLTLSFLSSAAMICAPAFAQSSAEDVADELIAIGEAQGMEVTVGSRSKSGDLLRLEDVRYALDEGKVDGYISLDWLNLLELPNGAVEISFPPTMIGSFVPRDEKGSMGLTVRNTGLTYTVSGTPDARGYDIAGETLEVSVELLDGPPELETFDFTLALGSVSGSALLAGGPTGTVKTSLRSETARVVYDLKSDDGGAQSVSDINGLAIDYEGDQMSVATADQMFSGAQGFTSQIVLGPSSARGTVTVEGVSSDMEGEVAGSSAVLAMGRGLVNYDVTARGIDYTVTTNAMPLPPIDVDMAEFGMRFAMPMGAPGTQAELAVRMTLRDLEVGEPLWAMIDPGKVLPRDPATLDINVVGEATSKIDFSSEDARRGMRSAPIDVSNLEIRDATIRAAGAELLAEGALTFNNAGPVPIPIGKVMASLRGANALMDNLAKIGLLRPEQALPARMMMGMFAVPGDGPDHVTSTVEFTADGRISANGIPLR